MELTKPWSYSALTAFETCPKRFQLTRVTKQVVEKQTEATLWGNQVHKALELFAAKGQPLPPEMQKYESYVKQILSIEGKLKLFAALAFAMYPWVQRVVTGFIWLKVEKFDKEVFTRDQLPEIWNEFMPRLSRVATAYDQDKWLPKPSGLCKNWCPVGRSLCEHCGV